MSKKEWGNITWILMHSLAEKINEEKFNECKNTLVKIIFDICKNLPCPDCREHAIQSLKVSKINNISNKSDLKSFLWEFHNIVNKKLKKDCISFEECNDKYSKAKFATIVITFFKVYNNIMYVEKMMADSFHRKRFLINLMKDLTSIKKYIQ